MLSANRKGRWWRNRELPLFHARAAATEKALSSIVERAVAGTISAAVAAERSRRRDLTSATWLRSSTRYCGASPCWQRYAKTANQNVIRSGIHNQWRSCCSGVTWSNFLNLWIRRAAAFKANWSLSSWHAWHEGRPASHYILYMWHNERRVKL